MTDVQEFKNRLDDFAEPLDDGNTLADVKLEPIFQALEPTPKIFDLMEEFLNWLKARFGSEDSVDLRFLEAVGTFFANHWEYFYYFFYGVLVLLFAMLIWMLAQHIRQLSTPTMGGTQDSPTSPSIGGLWISTEGLTGQEKLIALFRNALYTLQERGLLRNVDGLTNRELSLQLESLAPGLKPTFSELYPGIDRMIYSQFELDHQTYERVSAGIARLVDPPDE